MPLVEVVVLEHREKIELILQIMQILKVVQVVSEFEFL
tara:strand:- start:314 stop:427 length:114 start_codon:yes stop_codon:yes gene_type:complete